MDLRGMVVVVILLLELCCGISANMVLPVMRKFKGPIVSLSAIKDHDDRRRGRLLSAVDINLGGNGIPSDIGLYYTKIGLGTPAKEYYVQVDTGSDTLWVNCAGCETCPKRSGIGMDLTLFDPKSSNTSETVTCDDQYCTSMYGDRVANCNDNACPYTLAYGDGSSSTGYYVRDVLTYNQVNGNLQSRPESNIVVFGCGFKQSGPIAGKSNEALDGIMGFGQADSSALSQLAAAGKVKKVLSHCLDTNSGGGIFAIGEVVSPKYNKTSLIPKMAHYNVLLDQLEVGGEFIDLPTDIFDSGNGRGIVIDSGTTLAYLPRMIYDQVVPKILACEPDMETLLIDNQFTCFEYDGNVDDKFPVIKFHFQGISLTVCPHDYLFKSRGKLRCVGWMKSNQQNKNGKDMLLLGDIALANKLVVYDVENMEIGWVDHNCASSIQVKDETTGNVYTVGAHKLSSASSMIIRRTMAFSLFLVAMLNIF